MRKHITAMLILAACHMGINAQSADVNTHRQYLSGTGCDDTVLWDFKCSDGRNAGQWTKIGVPSCWELQGFGTYQYGMRFYGKATPEGIADEKGQYKHEFTLPQQWQGRQILLVFEAAFTEIHVQVNGRKAGSGTYQGGYTRHTIDVSDRVFFGNKKNRLEVEVLKESTNPQVNLAERRADYWNFGGIWRPVFIISKPAQNIRRVAIDAKGDGRFMADVFLNRAMAGCSVSVDIVDRNGRKVAQSPACPIAGDAAKADFCTKGIKAWNAEQPNLYTAIFTLRDAAGKTVHVEHQKFGFRTIEYRHQYNGDKEDGVFINGQKVIFKGVNRHSFRPETGRTLSKAKNIEDVRLIKSMNMNAVRLSHYPADPEFLDACDSLGLYVECEQPGWHWAHETITGSQIAGEMVMRDVNHPSIIFWSNGNEGGFNYELEPVFTRLDPQKRVVLYPWANRNGFETKHYRSWGETSEYMRQKEIFMPTEFLHGLYDGGHGAGLNDYWKLMMSNPRCAGGFLWDLMDQGVVRTDQNGIIDCVGNFGADGIVGPHMEKEGSFYTIREIWSPIQISIHNPKLSDFNSSILQSFNPSILQSFNPSILQSFNSSILQSFNSSILQHLLVIKNDYNFTNLKDCSLRYRWIDLPYYGGTAEKLVTEGKISLPSTEPGESVTLSVPKGDGAMLELAAIDPYGQEVMRWRFLKKNQFPSILQFFNFSILQYFNSSILQSFNSSILQSFNSSILQSDNTLTVTVGPYSYTFSKKDGRLMSVKTSKHNYSLSNGPRFVAAKRADRSDDGFYNHDDKQAFQKKTLYTEYADQGEFDGFELENELENGHLIARYRHGSLQTVDWRFFDDGSVLLSANAMFNGVVDLMGISFDYPESLVKSKRWVGRGPYRVWGNRMDGPQYGYWQTDYNDPIPGESWEYPEFKGYFAGVEWMQLLTDEGAIGISPSHSLQAPLYVGVFTPRDGRDHLLYDLPETGISILRVIPAVRNKVNTTDLNGPSAQPCWAMGQGNISAILRFE